MSSCWGGITVKVVSGRRQVWISASAAKPQVATKRENAGCAPEENRRNKKAPQKVLFIIEPVSRLCENFSSS